MDLGAQLHHDDLHKRKSPEGFVSLSAVAVLEPKRGGAGNGLGGLYIHTLTSRSLSKPATATLCIDV